jgi:hypothetical protein
MFMEMPSRRLEHYYQLDANYINARQNDIYVNQLEKWHKADVLLLQMARTAYDEACCGSSKRTNKADDNYTWITLKHIIVENEDTIRKIELIVFPHGAKSQNERNDVLNLFTAKRSGAILITKDGASRNQPGGILGNAQALADIGLRVMSAQKAVDEISCHIRKRDQIARQVATRTGVPLPCWVGKDTLLANQ